MEPRGAVESLRTVSRAEVAAHSTAASCWLIVGKHVVDVTTYLFSHPGGANTLLEHAGTDATDVFHRMGHSPAAEAELFRRCVGILAEHEGGNGGSDAAPVLRSGPRTVVPAACDVDGGTEGLGGAQRGYSQGLFVTVSAAATLAVGVVSLWGKTLPFFP